MRVERIDITTTEGQILVKTEGLDHSEGHPKNSLRYKAFNSTLCLYKLEDSRILCSAEWGNVTVNGTIVTKDNVNEALEPLFI
ncbi:hypothetical protein [Dysgonomonas sp. 520]|uniref:hypothetical protein n=1 Tax=Dysgonomonas sp. 520 TaxID=2302931 RepID=UPI0013D44F7E|nr:hypothetical protein [Dysgonomonas sp. 520]NDW10135.1 hypothetical protein [Dysgonomonas sp. 520]